MKNKEYKHFISLGYFCSVAMELERFGLRSESGPFDWVISDMRGGVLQLIESHFEDFLNPQYLSQNELYHQQYRNTKFGITFYHDFNQYKSLKEQLPDVQKKYCRRIDRFYELIKEPTLFVRYISYANQDDKEIRWIEENYDKFIALLKTYNCENDIIFIANNGATSKVIDIFNVEKDANDTVARRPFEKHAELREYFQSTMFAGRSDNLLMYNAKVKKRASVSYKLRKK